MTVPALRVEYCGESFSPPASGGLVIGREADVDIDDNPFLHRRFLELALRGELWWLSNVGSRLTATVANEGATLQAYLAPGASLPIVFDRTTVWFSAGPTTYDFDIVLEAAPFEPVTVTTTPSGTRTIGRVELTPDQRLLIVALCENVLRRGDRGVGSVPPSVDVAARLGWTVTKLNRKLDNVCQKLSDVGVRGLYSDGRHNAVNRRARLVEYAMSTHLVTAADLAALDSL